MDDIAVVRKLAARLLPGQSTSTAQVVRGEGADVLLLPGRAVVKVAHDLEAAQLPRRAALLAALAALGLPFAVPAPLTAVVSEDGRAAVALSWVPGRPLPPGPGPVRAQQLASLLAVLAGVDVQPGDGPAGVAGVAGVTGVAGVAGLLDAPHAYAGRARWPQLMDQAVALLPQPVRAAATARVQAARDLLPVAGSLVHGDLAGANLHWHPDGSLAGVLDWDLASAWDPAVDAACLAWFGWDAVAAAVGAHDGGPGAGVLVRARTWAATFALEQVARALEHGAAEQVVAARVGAAAAELAGRLAEDSQS